MAGDNADVVSADTKHDLAADNADVMASDNADVLAADNASVVVADNVDVLAADTKSERRPGHFPFFVFAQKCVSRRGSADYCCCLHMLGKSDSKSSKSGQAGVQVPKVNECWSKTDLGGQNCSGVVQNRLWGLARVG